MSLAEKARGVFRRNPDTKNPLDADKRAQLKSECEAILEKQDFGITDYNKFAHNMLCLVSNRQKEVSARLKDAEAKRDIDFTKTNSGEYRITVRFDLAHPVYGSQYERINYEKTTADTKKLDPHLKTIYRVSLPTDIKYISYVTDEVSKPVFPDGEYRGVHGQSLSEEQVQLFCRKVYGLYSQSLQNGQSAQTSG